MLQRPSFALVFTFLLAASASVPSASAQVVRFETTVGDFDMVLNPTNNPRLQGHVDNLLAYVENGNYRGSWINRAPEGFVLQMGSFFAHTKRPVLTLDSTRSVVSFAPVRGAPAVPGLSNTVGTVALALPGSNRDGGTSSFFINLGDNSSGLDTDFTVFAAIPDMTVINQIMALMQVDLRDELGTDPRDVHFQDIPLTENGFQVFIRRAFEVTDSLSIARARGGIASVMAASLAGGGGGGAAAPAALTAAIAPEPGSGVLILLALLSLAWLPARRRA